MSRAFVEDDDIEENKTNSTIYVLLLELEWNENIIENSEIFLSS